MAGCGDTRRGAVGLRRHERRAREVGHGKRGPCGLGRCQQHRRNERFPDRRVYGRDEHLGRAVRRLSLSEVQRRDRYQRACWADGPAIKATLANVRAAGGNGATTSTFNRAACDGIIVFLNPNIDGVGDMRGAIVSPTYRPAALMHLLVQTADSSRRC